MIINNIPNKESSNNRVNTNLLTNWYFANPVNRRGGFCFVPVGTNYYTDSGLTTAGNAITTSTVIGATIDNETYSHYTVSGVDYYISTADVKHGYYKAGDTIDRWRSSNSNQELTLDTDGILYEAKAQGQISQWLELPFESIAGKAITISAIINGILYSKSATIQSNIPTAYTTLAEITVSSALRVRLGYSTSASKLEFVFAFGEAGSCKLDSAKLELGDTQTLAYQDDNGNWQLYEIPNYEEELAKCVAIEPKVNNDNLLTNWYFKNPVNRKNGYYVPKGIVAYSDVALTTQYTASVQNVYPATIVNSTYATFTSSVGDTVYCKTSDCKKGYVTGGNTIDCWWNRVNMNDTATGVFLTDDGLKYEVLATSTSAQKHRFISQRIENYKNLLGKQVTLSMLIGDSHTSTTIENFFAARVHSSVRIDYHSTQLGTTSWSNKTGLHSITFTLPETITKDHTGLNASVYMRPDANTVSVGDYFVIEAIKLELGNKQTLAHQDKDGNWVLNEIPDYQEMYEKCSVYPVEHEEAYIGNGGFVPTSGNITMTGALYAHEGTDYTTYRMRNIAATTATITAGKSSLANGNILLQYE